MKKIVTIVFAALLSASSAQAVTRDECANGNGTYVNGKCFCETGTWKDGKCDATCSEPKKPAPKAAPAAQPGPRPARTAKFKAPSCAIDLASPITPSSAADPVTVTVTCQPGSGPIGEISAECLTDNCLFDGGAKKVARAQTPTLANGKVVLLPAQEKFVIRAADAKSGVPGTVAFAAKAKDGSSDPLPVVIKWPAPPAAPPPPQMSQFEKDCIADGGEPKDGICICKPPKLGIGWVDKDKKAHYCKDQEPIKIPVAKDGKDGKDGRDGRSGVAFAASTNFTGLAVDGHFLSGVDLMAGLRFNWGSGRWLAYLNGGMMYSPTAEYQPDGRQTRDASGNVRKNNSGLVGDAGFGFFPTEGLEIGAGVGYWRFGQHWSGSNSGQGSIEAMGLVGRIFYYPVRSDHVWFGLGLQPTVGTVWGGAEKSARLTGGFSGGLILTVQ